MLQNVHIGLNLKKILFTCFWFDVRNKCIYYRSKDTRHVISSTNTKLINKRDFSPPKMSQTLKKALDKYNWQSLPSNSCQTSVSHVQNIFSECFMNNFPTKNTKIKYNNRLPYITSGLRKSIKHKHTLRHAYAKDQTDENKQKCRTFNNKLTLTLKKTRTGLYRGTT